MEGLVNAKEWSKGVPIAEILKSPSDQVFALRCVCVQAVQPLSNKSEQTWSHSSFTAQLEKGTVPPSPKPVETHLRKLK